jgi:hypothetical protein
MAILRSLDGKFFEVPDEELEKYEMSEEKVKEMGGDPAEQEGPAEDQMMIPPGGEGMPGGVTINLNIGGGGVSGMMAPPPQAQKGEEGEAQQDVQGHGWVIYRNRYWAYRNRYWAYRNRY